MQHKALVITTLLGASSLTIMAGATIAPSLPAIRDHFSDIAHIDTLARLTLTLHAIFIAALAAPMGWLADRWSKRGLLLVSAIGYGAAGASGYVADSLVGILVGRAFLGIAVAGVMTCATALIADYFTGAERNRVMGFQAAAMAAGGVALLVFGGWVADLDWRNPFLIYLAAWLLVPMIWRLPAPPDPAESPESVRTTNQRVPWRTVTAIYVAAVLGQVIFYNIPVQVPFWLAHLSVGSAALTGLAIGVTSGVCKHPAIPTIFRFRSSPAYGVSPNSAGGHAISVHLKRSGHLKAAPTPTLL